PRRPAPHPGGGGAVSDHDPIEPDVLVQTALRLLPVPDHEPDFWTRLEEALDAEAVPVSRNVEEGSAALEEKPGHPGPGGPGPDAAGAPRTDEVPVVELVPAPVPGVVPAAMRRPSNLVLS